MLFEIGDIVETLKGDQMSGIKKRGVVIGFGKWRNFRTLKINTEDNYAKRKVSILEKNAIKLKSSWQPTDTRCPNNCTSNSILLESNFMDELRCSDCRRFFIPYTAYKEIKMGSQNTGGKS